MILTNIGPNPFVVSQGDRIAQLLIIPIHIELIREGEAPSELTVRGDKGFGSSDTVNVGAKIWIQKLNGPPKAAEARQGLCITDYETRTRKKGIRPTGKMLFARMIYTNSFCRTTSYMTCSLESRYWPHLQIHGSLG